MTEERAMAADKRRKGEPAPREPNAKTRAALRAVVRGDVQSFADVDELIADLNSHRKSTAR